MNGINKNEYKILVGKPLGEQLLGRQKRWKNNIKTNVREIDCEDVNCMNWLKLMFGTGLWY
jgi:hypothetical protein